jgi:SAM-dependent methyltransferase
MQSPRELVPIFLRNSSIKSVVDVGCGLGTFLRAFKEGGVEDVLGIDGKWCKKELLFENISQSEFLESDLELEIKINRKFDLAISLEVAEHLSPERAVSFVRDLCNLSDTIIFSAAIPFQGGDNHINERPLSYWVQIFNDHGYECFDEIRPVIWDNSKVFWWYRQNTLLFRKKINEIPKNVDSIINIVHPELLAIAANYKERNSIKRHAKLLFKSIRFWLNGI